MKRLNLIAALSACLALCAPRLAPAHEARKAASPRPLNVAVVIYAGVNTLDVSGPTEVFATAGETEPGSYNVYTVAFGPGSVPAALGTMSIQPRYSASNAPRPDLLIVPGASLQSVRAMYRDARFMGWLKQQALSSKQVMSVCTGAFLLGRIGLLDGKRATTHWFTLEEFAHDFPRVKAMRGARFVQDGRVLTTAGVSSGLDGSLRIVEQAHGPEAAEMVARAIQYRRNTPAYPEQALARVPSSTWGSAPVSPRRAGQKLASERDPVCGMAVSPSTRLTSEHGGKLYGFCSPSCLGHFRAHPEEYLKPSRKSAR